uniref:Uncharacterized protein n=1 Tax=Arundo donax TaxID=35708 RepID=A0A0A9HCZ3_ARUDO
MVLRTDTDGLFFRR